MLIKYWMVRNNDIIVYRVARWNENCRVNWERIAKAILLVALDVYYNTYIVNGSCWKFSKGKNVNRKSYLWISHDYGNDWCN